MELYTIGDRSLSSDDLAVLRSDIGLFLGDVLKKGGRFEQIDQDSNGYLTITELDGFIKAASATGLSNNPVAVKEAQALRRSIDLLSRVNWDPVLFGPQISRQDLEKLPQQLRTAMEKIRTAEQQAEAIETHFYKIRACFHQRGQEPDEINQAQITHYLKTATLSDEDRNLISQVFNTPMWRAWRVQYMDVLHYPHSVQNRYAELISTGLALWRDLPKTEYVPYRPAETFIGSLLKGAAELLSRDDTPPVERVNRSIKALEASPHPRYVARVLKDLQDAASGAPDIAKTAQFQKVAAMAGGPYDPSFTKAMKARGVAADIKNYFEQYRTHGLPPDDSDIRR